MHSEYALDVSANAGPAGPKALGVDQFRQHFKTAPDLRNVCISNLKRNFCRCPTCRRLEKGVQRAIKNKDPLVLEVKKEERRQHLLLMRSEKMNYYYEREMARAPVGLKITLIIDKMDSAKNVVPCFTNRMTKDLVPDISVRVLPLITDFGLASPIECRLLRE